MKLDSSWILWICLSVELVHASSHMTELCTETKCFLISQKQHKLSWDKARDYCHGSNAYLAAIRNIAEHRLIESFLKNDTSAFWIGAKLNREPNTPTPPPPPPKRRAPPRPPPPRRVRRDKDDDDDDDDDKHKPKPPEPPQGPRIDCRYARQTEYGHEETYHDKSSTELERTLCLSYSVARQCPRGFDMCGENLCWRLYNEVNWYDAKMQCLIARAKLPGSSVEPSRQEGEIKSVIGCLSKTYSQFSFWTNYCDPKWEWDAESVALREVKWWAWAPGAPSPHLMGCVLLEIEDGKRQWRDDGCDWEKRFICEKSLTSREDSRGSSAVEWAPRPTDQRAPRPTDQRAPRPTNQHEEFTIEPVINVQESQQDGDPEAPLGLYITVPIAAVMLIVIVTLLVVILRYRRRKEQEQKDLLSMGSTASYQSSASFSREEARDSISHVSNPSYGTNNLSKTEVEMEVLRRQVAHYERLERERIMRLGSLPYLPLNLSRDQAAELSRSYADIPYDVREALRSRGNTLSSNPGNIYDYIDGSFRRGGGGSDSYLEPTFRRHSPSKRTSRLISQTSDGYHSDSGSSVQDQKYLTLLDEYGRPSTPEAKDDLPSNSNSEGSYQGDDDDDDPVYRDTPAGIPSIHVSEMSSKARWYDDVDDDPVYNDHPRSDGPDVHTSGRSRRPPRHAPLRRMDADLNFNIGHSTVRRSRSAEDAVERPRTISERRFTPRNTEKRAADRGSKISNGLLQGRKSGNKLPSHMRRKTVERTQSAGEVSGPSAPLPAQNDTSKPGQSRDMKQGQDLLIVAV